ncbi:MAG: hypothetical protein AAF531_24390 [Actinomycetota bacterium]
MPRNLSLLTAAVGVLLAVVVTVGGIRTSSARFTASTGNRGNLWEAAEIALAVDEEGTGTADLFLSGADVHTGTALQNCVLIDLQASTDMPRLRVHGEILADNGLAPYFDILIERGSVEGGCDRFTTTDEVYRGTLLLLATNHGSFDQGVSIVDPAQQPTPLRFSGSIQDTNEAQGRTLDYTVHVEAKP